MNSQQSTVETERDCDDTVVRFVLYLRPALATVGVRILHPCTALSEMPALTACKLRGWNITKHNRHIITAAEQIAGCYSLLNTRFQFV